MAFDGIRSGTEAVEAAPAGEVEVVLGVGGETLVTCSVTVAAGEVTEVVFER